MGSEISGLADGLQSIVGMLGKADPLNDLVDIGASLLGLPPEVKDVVKIGAGIFTGDVNLVVQGGVGLGCDLARDVDQAQTQYHPPHGAGGEASCPGYAHRPPGGHGVPGGAPPDSSCTPVVHRPPDPCQPAPGGQSALDPDVYQYRHALQVLQANFATLDAGGRADGKISREDLRNVAHDPHASQTLRDAASFMLEHRDYGNRLEHGARPFAAGGGPVTLGSVSAELGRVDRQIATYGGPAAPPPTPASASSAPANTDWQQPAASDDSAVSRPSTQKSNPISSILHNPAMSIEDKIEALTQQLMGSIDHQIEDVMGQMATMQDKDDAASSAITQSKGDPKGGAQAGAAAQQQHQELQRGMEQLQAQLQKLMERRNQMFTLQTTMSEKFNEMAKMALQNMGRA